MIRPAIFRRFARECRAEGLRRDTRQVGLRAEALEARSMFAADVGLDIDRLFHAASTDGDENHSAEQGWEFTDAGGRTVAACPVAPDRIGAAASPTALLATTDTFLLHSRRSATKTIYLDFDGHTTVGTAWNSGSTDPIVTPVYDTDGRAAFSTTELAAIQQIWSRVAEDFAPFDVDVTTQAPSVDDLMRKGATDTRWGIRVAIGGSCYDWLKVGCGGIAYLTSFNWDSDTPCYVFPKQLAGGDPKVVAEAVSHEVGHTLGLSHDGTATSGYYGGHGSGAMSWAPIMGVGFDREVVQWSRGEYTGANNTEDDLAIITTANGFGYRPDDAGNTVGTARDVGGLGASATTFAGVIERNTDVDVFSFTTAGSFRVTVSPASTGANVDILAEIRDASGVLVATSNPADRLDASFEITVAPGRYTLSVRGAGFGNPLTNGFSGYGSLGQYAVSMNAGATLPTIEVAAIDAAAAETAAGQTANPGVFRFVRSGPTTASLTIPIAVSGSATGGADYHNLPTAVTFSAGSSTALLDLRVIDDAATESAETVTLSVTAGTGYAVVGSPATVTIADNDVETKVGTRIRLVGDEPRARRDHVAVFTVALVDASGRPIAGVKIEFKAECRAFGTVSLGSVTTDASGRAVLRYKVPKDPNADNITLSATFHGTARYGASSLKQRLKIG